MSRIASSTSASVASWLADPDVVADGALEEVALLGDDGDALAQ